MKMQLGALFLTVFLYGCSDSAPAAATRVDPAPIASQGGATITMTPAAQRESGVVTAALVLRNVPEIVRSTARLTNDENRTWRVGAVAEGRIVTVLANVGDVVREDQMLARMHSHQIHEARADYEKAKAEGARRKGLIEFAVKVRDRTKRLYDLTAASQEQLDRAETDVQNAEIDAANAHTEIERARSHITEVLGLSVDDVAPGKVRSEEDDLIPVRSPAAGVVLSRNVTPGTVVTPSVDQFVISDLSGLWAIAEVNEENLGRIHVGMPVRVQVQAYGEEIFSGRIGKIGDVLDPATRTIKVRVELRNNKGRLKPEMYANAEIQLGSSSPIMTVPAEAIQDVRNQTSIFVRVAEDRFEVRPVRTGRTIDHNVEVSGPIKAGESVAVGGAFLLKSEFLKASLAN